MKLNDIFTYKLKKELPINYTQLKGSDIDYLLTQAKSKVLTYLHRKDLPTPLYYVVSDIALDILKDTEPELFYKKDNAGDLIVDSSDIKSIKVGDTNITLGDRLSAKSIRKGNSGSGSIDNYLNSYISVLQAYRKLYKGDGSSYGV